MNIKQFLVNCVFLLQYSIVISVHGEIDQLSHLSKTNHVPIPIECVEILKQFAQTAANFTLCSIVKARPVRLCELCVTDYVQFHRKYDELLSSTVNGTSCQSLYVSQDRLEVVKEYHDNILSVWDKGNCNECFDWSTAESYPEVSNKTKKFNKMSNETMECIYKHIDNKETVCDKCKQSYLELDQYYKSMSRDSIGVETVCMDVVDSMNSTRFIWSKTLECCKRQKTPEILFLCCTAIISSLPILFYVAMKYCGPIRDLQNVLKQTRFKQTFLRSRSQNTN